MPAHLAGARPATPVMPTARAPIGGSLIPSTSSRATPPGGSWSGSPSPPAVTPVNSSSTTSTSIRMRRAENTPDDQRDDVLAADPADRLLEDSWSDRQRRPGRRELLVETVTAALFLSIALPIGLPVLASPHLDAGLVLLLVGLYAFVAGT